MTDEDDALLIHLLTEQGCSWEEIEKVRERLRDYDKRVTRESVFDSIAAGTFSLQALVEEVRREPRSD